MTSPYWPVVREIDLCIRTEAEELADATVLAVHEPMVFRKVPVGEGPGELVGEFDLLDHVIQTRRPTPVIGDSGFGKSHVIRWLDVQLKRQKRDDWHIVRIAKNVSLRQALTSLLDGLHGAQFDEARQKIDSVGVGLKTEDVAQHLVVFVSTRLRELYEETGRQVKELADTRSQVHRPNDKSERRIRSVRRHAKRGGLASLLGDSHFKAQLVGQGKCFYQVAKRLIEGSTDEEIESDQFDVTVDDLVVQSNLSDLSIEARNYVRDARLNTAEEVREEAAALLNECLTDASQRAFQQLFQFNSGSFQDLFYAIRTYLRNEGKTLFVLVEDMAAISAIENVLIDSLMQEDIRGGVEVLCPLHSAIAVTTGYRGYAGRRDTLTTRAGYEWRIEKSGETEEETVRRLVDFCGRYLNAARHGAESLIKRFSESEPSSKWPGIWKSEDQHYRQTAELFGVSSSGFPLFPYSALSLEALARRYCQSVDTLEFNPRKILKRILREPLMTFRDHYSEGHFPPEKFANIACPSSLQAELRRNIREDVERAETLSAIWGFGTETLSQLAYVMPAPIAAEFGLGGLARLLETTERTPPKDGRRNAPPIPIIGERGAVNPTPRRPPLSEDKDVRVIYREVDEYFVNRSIPQHVANEIRRSLVEAFEKRKENFSDWYGIREWPSLKQGQRFLVAIPFNDNNPKLAKMTFGSPTEFNEQSQSLPFKQFIVAVLRRNEASSAERITWTYKTGREDYFNYSNFLDAWMPDAVEALVTSHRDEAAQFLKEQIAVAMVFDPQLPGRSVAERLNRMVMTSESILETVNVNTGFEEWDQFLVAQLAAWAEGQARWLGAFSTNRHALEGDLARKVLRSSSDVSVPAVGQRVAQKAAKEVARRLPALDLVGECSTREEFLGVMGDLMEFVTKLGSANQFLGMDGITTARKYKNLIEKIVQTEKWEGIKCALMLGQPFEAVATIKALQCIDVAAAQRVNDVLQIWKTFYDTNRQRLINENEERGATRRKKCEDSVAAIIEKFGKLMVPSESKAK